MKDSIIRTVLSLVSVFVIIASVSVCLSSCQVKDNNETTVVQTTVSDTTEATQNNNDELQTTVNTSKEDIIEMGVGENTFIITFTFADGSSKMYDISTNEKTVGAALVSLNLISGDQGDYGLYVKTVDGVTADYTTDGAYWAFYINGEYALTGVDSTQIASSSKYELKIEKAQQ